MRTISYLFVLMVLASSCVTRKKTSEVSTQVQTSASVETYRDSAFQQQVAKIETIQSSFETVETEHSYIVLDSSGVSVIRPILRTRSARSVQDQAKSEVEAVVVSVAQSAISKDTLSLIDTHLTEKKTSKTSSLFFWVAVSLVLLVLFILLRKGAFASIVNFLISLISRK
jgi:hypothetical protein